MDRSVIIRMKRRAPNEKVEPFRLKRVVPEAQPLYDRLAAWAARSIDDLRDADPEMPPGIVDRPADVWEPLIAVGDAAGGDWPSRARDAATSRIRLLADIQAVFFPRDGQGELVPGAADRHSSADLANELCEVEEAPWGDWYGKRLDARGLAKMLKPFDVHPHTVRIGDRTPKGYEAADFRDAWTRYLEEELPKRTPDVAEMHAPSGAATAATRSGPATEKGSLTCDVADVADVAATEGERAMLRTENATDGSPGDQLASLGQQLSALDPNDSEDGLRVAQLRAQAVLARRHQTGGVP
jgi:hypothetical protein